MDVDSFRWFKLWRVDNSDDERFDEGSHFLEEEARMLKFSAIRPNRHPL